MTAVAEFIRNHYSDAQVIKLGDDLEAGTFEFRSCCCLVGRATNHGPIHIWRPDFELEPHFIAARALPGACEAEWELPVNMEKLAAFLKPIVQAEIAYRTIRVVEAVTA